MEKFIKDWKLLIDEKIKGSDKLKSLVVLSERTYDFLENANIVYATWIADTDNFDIDFKYNLVKCTIHFPVTDKKSRVVGYPAELSLT